MYICMGTTYWLCITISKKCCYPFLLFNQLVMEPSTYAVVFIISGAPAASFPISLVLVTGTAMYFAGITKSNRPLGEKPRIHVLGILPSTSGRGSL